ncbi:GNAT family N-acetyltransferase [Dyadobacter frigoris]|uniref:GNAT family N-acetyltransferase n=1 Tax=Dyadobacter frigoris TaxID=2576211 RepID=A0A4U6CWA8_9BACT|nr:GNAT family N-acetyltransferase [Dyadobacter frigoris]TKT88586.1 GNAT family N-acetyltransferase [Dyadobacter frigoris]GLU54638.1 N-acetyltransferase [Dyadobacter frigoris]
MSIEIKKVSVEDILPIRHKVLWPDKPIEFVNVEGDEEGIHFGLYEDSKLVTIISLFEEGKSMRFRKFATLPEYQNRGFGKMMILKVIDYAKENDFQRLWCDARTDALNFYERAGFQKFSEPFFKENIEYNKIEKIL